MSVEPQAEAVRGVQVAVDAPIKDKLTYLASDDFTPERGQIVNVSLGKRSVKAAIMQVLDDAYAEQNKLPPEAKRYTLKKILSLDEDLPQLKDPFLKWIEWVSNYYAYPLGQVVQLCFPPLSKKTKERASKRPAVVPTLERKSQHNLTDEQNHCLQEIKKHENFSVHLVHGVTGSGKTEIYLNLFEKNIREGKRGLFLVPEISLTPQLVNRFAERFGDQIAVLHSQLTARERTNQWWDIVQGDKKILVGARSALFCPVDNVGLIVIDEEHEASYKQDEKLKYNGRDAAIMLAKFLDCPIVLGSATPSLESWKNAQDGKFHLHQLKSRVENRPLPDIEIVDMRLEKDLEKKSPEKPFWLSQKLYNEIKIKIANKEQTALLLNRRGMANVVFCPSCGYTAECPNCDIGLTLHAHAHLVCHYCDYHENFKVKCSDCKEGELVPMGLGTEKVEEDLRKLFPESSIARADRDEINSRAELEELIEKMEKSEIDILIGTQMIAKGLDFPNLKLVGLLLADVGFNLPDFRSSERSFQLMTQMSGRSGRHTKIGEDPGRVFIQTYNTSHDSLEFAQRHDFEGFAANELNHRRQLNYPPFHKMAAIRVQSLSLDKVQQTCSMLSQRSYMIKEKYQTYKDVEILGPAQAPMAKLRNQFRYHLILKHAQAHLLNQFITLLLADEDWIPSQVKVLVDIDPINLL
ncbi:MAG: primosomal protein N' [Bdellovibrio sp.]|nr:primosomal protein N' [Bdellovibrio sp.]